MMKWQELKETDCPIARSLSILGDRWTLLIIRNAFLKCHRFDDFQKQLGITRHLLSERLKRLVQQEILIKVLYQEHPTRYEYQLTEKGKALFPLLFSITQWGNEWENPANRHPRLVHTHSICGEVLDSASYCIHCQEQIELHDIRLNKTA